MKEVLQIAYLRHLQDFYLFESVKDGVIPQKILGNNGNPANFICFLCFFPVV